MESKNVLLAVILSSIVLIFWGTFFEAPVVKQAPQNQISKNDNMESPSIDETENKTEITRTEAINSTKRIKLENENIKGSISLQGGIIDDIILSKI